MGYCSTSNFKYLRRGLKPCGFVFMVFYFEVGKVLVWEYMIQNKKKSNLGFQYGKQNSRPQSVRLKKIYLDGIRFFSFQKFLVRNINYHVRSLEATEDKNRFVQSPELREHSRGSILPKNLRLFEK